MFCKKCGKYISEGQKFCPNCGEPVVQDDDLGKTKIMPDADALGKAAGADKNLSSDIGGDTGRVTDVTGKIPGDLDKTGDLSAGFGDEGINEPDLSDISDFPDEVELFDDPLYGLEFPENDDLASEDTDDADFGREGVDDSERLEIQNKNKKLNIIAIAVSVAIIIVIVIVAVVLSMTFGGSDDPDEKDIVETTTKPLETGTYTKDETETEGSYVTNAAETTVAETTTKAKSQETTTKKEKKTSKETTEAATTKKKETATTQAATTQAQTEAPTQAQTEAPAADEE